MTGSLSLPVHVASDATKALILTSLSSRVSIRCSVSTHDRLTCEAWERITPRHCEWKPFSLQEEKAWFGSLLLDTGHLWMRGSPSHCASDSRLSVYRRGQSVPSLITIHRLSECLLQESFRKNQREMLYTLMAFPQCPPKTTAPQKLLFLG